MYHFVEKILGNKPRIAIEAASKFGWEKYVGLTGDIIGMDGFGASAPGGELFKYFGITVEEVVDAVNKILTSFKKELIESLNVNNNMQKHQIKRLDALERVVYILGCSVFILLLPNFVMIVRYIISLISFHL